MSNLEAASHAAPRKRTPKKSSRPKSKVKAKSKRRRRERMVVPAEKRWLNWREAEGVSGLSRNSLRPHLLEIGAKRVGNRLIIDRLHLDAWLAAQPSAAP
jgi:hypothetical protein